LQIHEVVVDHITKIKPSKDIESVTSACEVLFKGKKKTPKLKHNDPRQQAFVRSLLDMVCVDGLPLSFGEGLGFRNFMEKSSPEYVIPCRTKLLKSLKEELKSKVLSTFNDELEKLQKGSLHISLDIWSTCSRESVIGLKIHYINEDWEQVTKTLAFKQMSGSHTGEAIKRTYLGILSEHKISEDQVGYVMGDNASNISKAFNIEEIILDDWTFNPDESEAQGVGQSDPMTEDNEEESGLTAVEEVAEGHDEVEEPDDVIMARDFYPTNLEQASIGVKRLRCLAHTIQLAINDAIKTDEKVKDVVHYLNQVIKTFRKSPLKSDTLSAKIKRQLIPIGTTRWNSILFAAERMTEVKIIA